MTTGDRRVSEMRSSAATNFAVALLMGGILLSSLLLFASYAVGSYPPPWERSALPAALGILLLTSLVPLERYRRRYA